MKMKESFRDYLVFTRKERTAILVMLALITAVFFLPTAQRLLKSASPPLADTAWANTVATLEEKQATDKKSPPNSRRNQFYADRTGTGSSGKPPYELFYFDPNTLTAEGWKKLGLREKTIAIILNYVAKGGRFRKPGDLKKIYGLFPDEYERIASYIQIPESIPPDAYKQNFIPAARSSPSAKPRYNMVEINTADTSAFIALPGIGSKLASRIISFREKLGGFYSVEQVKETYGLPDSTFQRIRQYLKLEESSVRKININTASADQLKIHPYIRWNIAKAIVSYRSEHGLFRNIEDIKKIMVVTEDDYKKISPYCTL